MEELRKHLSSHLTPESGLVGLILSDREGVPLLRATKAECPDSVTRPAFLAAFAGSSQEVGGKLGLGRNTSLVAVYGQHQVIHHQHQHVILTMVATSDANTGRATSLTRDSVHHLILLLCRRPPQHVGVLATFHGRHQQCYIRVNTVIY